MLVWRQVAGSVGFASSGALAGVVASTSLCCAAKAYDERAASHAGLLYWDTSIILNSRCVQLCMEAIETANHETPFVCNS